MEQMKERFWASGKTVSGECFELFPDVSCDGEVIKVLLPKERLAGIKCTVLRMESSLTTVPGGSEGYMFFPVTQGTVKCDFTERPDASSASNIAVSAVCGVCGNERATYVQVMQMESDARFVAEVKDNIYTVGPEFVLDGDAPEDDFLVIYRRMPYATYVDMAKVYREYQLKVKGCVPLKERAGERAELKKAADGVEIRIRMGWKPQPTPVRKQTIENEPPMHIACDIAQLNRIIEVMKEKGVENAELCLVGWGPGGHDGRFPQQYPSDERFGGDEALKSFIEKAQSYGYQVVCHTNSKGAYEIADNWDPDFLTKCMGEDGEPKPWLREDYAVNGLQGGDPWHVCPKPAYEHYAAKDLPVVSAYGYRGLHYVDELTACFPLKCYDKEHPVSRKEAIGYYREIAKLSRQLFGGFQSEGWYDFMNADVDYVLYTSAISEVSHEINPLYDELIPFWMLVFHGIVMANATCATINYPIKRPMERLKVVEFGARPLLYINSKFCGRDWMGAEDLLNDTEESIARSVEAIKTASDEYEPLKHLQYEYMENHEKLSEGVYRVTYSDGTMITVDYNQNCYHVEK